MPLVIGLASKNNVISKLTGIQYGSFGVLHRWAGRLCLLLAIIHAIGRTYVNVPSVERGYKDWVPIKWCVHALLLLASFS